MATVYLMHIDEVGKVRADYGENHFPRRMVRAAEYRFPQDRLLCFGAGVLLHGVLGVKEESLALGEHGKPEAADFPLAFNLSHGGDYVALAVGEHPVGVDVEKCDKRHLTVARRVMTPEEQAWMAKKRTERFAALWTMKESVSKALGKGILLPFDSFSVLPLLNGESVRVEGVDLFGETLPLAGYGLSVCTVGAKESTQMICLTAEDIK